MPRKAKASSEQDVLVMQGIGARIKALRERAGLSPKEFGLLGGISQPQQYRIELGERVPDVIYAVKVAGSLGVSVDDLLIGSTIRHAPHAQVIVNAPTGNVAGRDMTIHMSGRAASKKRAA
jgi:DNA-binding XRE family transcriptional regulator